MTLKHKLRLTQSLHNEMNILRANIYFQSEYEDTSLIALTEMWLQQRDPQFDIEITGFLRTAAT